MYYLRTLIQFLTFFLLFLATHYWMGQEDVFDTITFWQALSLFVLSSSYTGLLIVIIIQLFTSFSYHWFYRTAAFLFVFIQLLLIFSYLEYYIVFKVPLHAKNIIYVEDPSSVWQLAEGLVWNIRFPFFVILPAVFLFFTLFAVLPNKLHRNFVFRDLSLPFKLGVWITMVIVSLSLYSYYPHVEEKLKIKEVITKFGFKQNPLISTYEAAINFFQYKEEFVRFSDLSISRQIFPNQEKRVFVDPKFPLLQRSSSPSPANLKNIIILMMESFPIAEIYPFSKNPDFFGTTPFLDKFLSNTLYFPNAYASGIHTFYGFSDLLTGTAGYEYQSWNRKIDQELPHTLPHLLERNGYMETTWYYGGSRVNFDFMKNFSTQTGFNRTFFYDSFPPDAKNSNWGKSDRETLMAAAREIKQFKGPFLAYILSLSKHGPFNIPSDFNEKGFTQDFLSRHNWKIPNSDSRNTHRLIYYYDQVLQEFFDTLKGHPNFENSLVILTSDQASFPNHKGQNLYETMKSGFNIPLIFYEPGKKTLPLGKNEVFASHLDIIPTLVKYLGLTLPKEVPYQGRDILDPIYQQFPDRYFHIGFWQSDLIHFSKRGMDKLSMDPNKPDITHVGLGGEESPSTDDEINRMMSAFKTAYPYLIKNNLIFPSSKN